MEKKLTPRRTSSPVCTRASPVSMKDDSFLEDMGLLSQEVNNYGLTGRDAERYVTRRTLSPAIVPFATVLEGANGSIEGQSSEYNSYIKVFSKSETKTSTPVVTSATRDAAGAQKPVISQESKGKRRSQDGKTKLAHEKPTPVETHSKLYSVASKQHAEWKSNTKERSRRSGSCKDADQSSDASKENKQPSNLSRQKWSPGEAKRDHHRQSDGSKKLESRELPESVALLSAIKEVVRTYTKEEGTKVLRALNELHILGQASLIKNLMFQTDEIRKDLQLGENLGHLRVLMAENERLKENFVRLKMRIEDLQSRLEETERIKDENTALKLRLQELEGQSY